MKIGNVITAAVNAFLAVALLALGGCATTDQRVNFLYAPSYISSGGSGDLYVVEPAGSKAGNASSQWILGKITDTEGNQTGNITSPVRPVDLVVDAFSVELKAAGYNAMASTKSPDSATRVVVLESVNLEMKEIANLVKAEADCRLKVTLKLMKNGKLIKNLYFEAGNKNTVVTDKAGVVDEIIRTTLQDIMKQAVPEIVSNFEKPV